MPPKPVLLLTTLTGSVANDAEPARATQIVLAAQLQQSNQLRLASDAAVLSAWRRISGGAASLPNPLDPKTARNIALRCSAELVLFGNLSRVAGEPVLQVQLQQVGNDPAVSLRYWSRDFPVRSEADLPSAAFEASSWVRSIAGEAAAEIGNRSRRPEDLTTPSWQALLEFTRSREAWRAGDSEASLLHLRTALDLDPGFARASQSMADHLVSLGRRDEGLVYYAAAADGIRQRNLTDRESLTIEGLFAQDTGQLVRAEQLFSRYALEYPDDGLPLFYTAAAVDRMGKLDRALELSKEAVARDPQSYSFLMQEARLLLDNRQIDEAAAMGDRGAKLNGGDWTDLFRSGIAMARLDPPAAWSAIERMRITGSPQYQSLAYSLQACFRAEQGRWQDAEQIVGDGVSFDSRKGFPEQQRFNKQRILTQIFLKQGRAKSAADTAESMLQIAPGHENRMSAGCLLAQAGRTDRAERCLPPNLPDWPIYDHWSRRLKAEILLAQRKPSEALKLLLDAPPPKLKNQWPEYLVRAAIECGDRTTAARYVAALFRNPGGYWIQADSAGPGFISWAATLAEKLDLPGLEVAQARSLRKSLGNV